MRYYSGWLAGYRDIARTGEQFRGATDNGTVTIIHGKANGGAERYGPRLRAARCLPDRGQGGRARRL
jgi:hypothetical protein